MNASEKLRFLADRAEDGKVFYIGSLEYAFKDNVLFKMFDGGYVSNMTVNAITLNNLRLKPQWIFTEDEKVILRNLPKQYKWIARDDCWLFIYTEKPFRTPNSWASTKQLKLFDNYNHLFQSIQWSDDEPCEFRDYL